MVKLSRDKQNGYHWYRAVSFLSLLGSTGLVRLKFSYCFWRANRTPFLHDTDDIPYFPAGCQLLPTSGTCFAAEQTGVSPRRFVLMLTSKKLAVSPHPTLGRAFMNAGPRSCSLIIKFRTAAVAAWWWVVWLLVQPFSQARCSSFFFFFKDY